uniref:Uncharacterized protein n=1 Tax=Anguilla anguilla TaxID=7936 RepID=A0A0E9TH77_ANGAN
MLNCKSYTFPRTWPHAETNYTGRGGVCTYSQFQTRLYQSIYANSTRALTLADVAREIHPVDFRSNHLN